MVEVSTSPNEGTHNRAAIKALVRPISPDHKYYSDHEEVALNRKCVFEFISFITSKTVNEHLPTPLDATSEPPPLFDGTTRILQKKEFAEELIAYTDTFNKTVYTSFKGDTVKEAGPAFDHLENVLHKFDDGPFFLGQFSFVDIAYIPFVERFQVFFSAVWNYDITTGRPKLTRWIEELNKIDAYKPTKVDAKVVIESYKARFQAQQ
uniref:Glutathione S-transferase n=1 Tax=Quercus lobata TaxID=97700 RepID=A0A7N2R8D8_QUELO